MINSTIEKFGYPATLIKEYDHWTVQLRPAQVTLGSVVVAAKSEARDFGDLSQSCFAELKDVAASVSSMLQNTVNHGKLNWLMLMMVDPHVHFHVFPRYEGARQMQDLQITDTSWPGPPDLGSAITLDQKQIAKLVSWLQKELP